MTTRRELIGAVGQRYRAGNRHEKHEIIEEFIKLTGYHRKHSIRVLCREARLRRQSRGHADATMTGFMLR
jgi:hypothetical protein